MGVVFVLLIGEIDLSIGYVSGIGGVVRRGAPDRRQLGGAARVARDHLRAARVRR